MTTTASAELTAERSAATAANALAPVEQKLLGFLAAGVSQTAAALACGVTDGYVSQLLERPDFSSALSLQNTEKLGARIAHDDTIETLEATSLKLLGQKLPFARGPMEVAKIWSMLNSAKKHATPDNQRQEALGAQMVTLVLPKAAAVQIQLNSIKQVTEVNGRSMATLPSRALPSLSADRREIVEALDKKEIEKATETLENASPHKTVIGGVIRVL